MSITFVDTVGWIASLNRSDNLHVATVRCFQSLAQSDTPLLTTSLVLAEVDRQWTFDAPAAGNPLL